MPAGLADNLRLRVAAVAVERYGGSFSAEHGVGPRNIAAYRRFTAPPVQSLAGHIQSLFAPVPIGRPEERRVGKECVRTVGSRWQPMCSKKRHEKSHCMLK